MGQALTFAQEQDAEAAAAGRADLDGDFEPTFINSVIFLVSLTMQVRMRVGSDSDVRLTLRCMPSPPPFFNPPPK